MFLFFIGLVFFIFGAMYLWSVGVKNSTTVITPSTAATPQPTFSVEFPIAILVKFKSPSQNISTLEIAKLPSSKIYIDQKLLTSLSELEEMELAAKIGFANPDPIKAVWTAFTSDDFNSFNSNDYPADAILLTHFAKVDFRLKMLSLENAFLLRDADYALKVKISRQGVDQSKLESTLASELGIPQAKLGFDLAQVKRIFIGGEIIPARAVDRLFLNTSNNYTFLFDRFKDEMKSADLTIAMLENPISGDPKPCTGCTSFVGDGRNAKGFADVGIDMLASGNHFGDGGLKALQDTEKLLTEQGISLAGVSSKNLAGAEQVQIRDFAGKKLGLVSFDDVGYFYWAGANKWGANYFSKAGTRGNSPDLDRIKKVITEAKSQVDYLVVYASWGIEYTDSPNASQQQMAHAIIDSGADLMLASHPHWVQSFESYKGKPIFYSFGNFIFDQTHTEQTRQGLLVNAYYYDGGLLGFQFMPDLTCGYHQSKNNLANQVIDGKITYAEVDSTPEKTGCIYWQPKQVYPGSAVYQQIWDRFTKSTKLN